MFAGIGMSSNKIRYFVSIYFNIFFMLTADVGQLVPGGFESPFLEAFYIKVCVCFKFVKGILLVSLIFNILYG